MKKLSLFLFIFFICFASKSNAQTDKVSNKAEIFHQSFPTEKLFLSFDKPYYSVGDTLWFKSFLLNGDHNINNRSDRIYVELFNDSLQLIENRVISLNNGLGYGDFALTNKLREGTYLIRAYSNWQQNLGSEYFFYKNFYIGNANETTWLLNSYQELNTTTNKTLNLKLKITNLKNEVIGLKDIELNLMNGNKRLAKTDLQTKLDGTIDTKIPIETEKINSNYNIVIVDKLDRTKKSILPILLQSQDQLDLQFMPEGGYMVSNIFGKVAFKAVGSDGLGQNISGKIINSKNETVVDFVTNHKGMGSFYILPAQDENYIAVYNLNGKEQRKTLPKSINEGTTIRIDHLSKKDSLYIYIKASEQKRLNDYQLLAQSAGEIILKADVNLMNGFSTLKLAKQDFPDGIIHFTLFSPNHKPINERQAFINRIQKIQLNISPNKNEYLTRDSIAVELTMTKEDGSPLSGSFSVAVTDDLQVKQDEHESDISSYFLLESDLKGNIESPAWYFNQQTAASFLALDHLLLTQGWIGYNWDKIFNDNLVPQFKAEKGNEINGRLTNLINKPVPNINLTLMSTGKTIFITDTVSNSNGYFKFKDLPLFDSVAYTIKIKNAKGKTSAATINVDEFIPAKSINSLNNIKPWYVNVDSTLLNYYQTFEKINKPKELARIKLEGTTLKEVEIRGQTRQKEINQTQAWDANHFKKITEEELKKTPRKTLMDLLKEKVPGFNVGDFFADGCFGTSKIIINDQEFPPGARPYKHNFTNYMIGGKLITHVLIDKVNTHMVTSGQADYYNENPFNISRTAREPEVFFTNGYLFNTLSAEDIIDIVIYKGCNNYFLDIKTRSGKGPWIDPSKGIYVYRPLPLYMAKDFYSPKYNVSNINPKTDLRSTIFWDANVVTDENGKAKISFYAADRPSNYTLKVQGTDLQGRFGSKKGTLVISKKTSSK